MLQQIPSTLYLIFVLDFSWFLFLSLHRPTCFSFFSCRACVPPAEAKADKAFSNFSILGAVCETKAFVAANDDMIMVVFRGTRESTDWAPAAHIHPRDPLGARGAHDQDAEVHKTVMSTWTVSLLRYACLLSCRWRWREYLSLAIALWPLSCDCCLVSFVWRERTFLFRVVVKYMPLLQEVFVLEEASEGCLALCPELFGRQYYCKFCCTVHLLFP